MGAPQPETDAARLTGTLGRPGWGRVALFLGVYLGLEFSLLAVGAAGGMSWLTDFTAQATHLLARLTGVHSELSGQLITVPGRVLLISLECTAAYVVAGFAALVFASPASVATKAQALLLGVPALLLANIGRLVVVAHVAERAPSAFQFTHDYLFQFGMVVVAVALWVWWLRAVRPRAA